MAELSTLARPYAKAAFEVAKTDNELGLWAEALNLAAAVSEDSKIKTLLGSPALTADQKCESLLEVLGLGEHVKFSNFLHALAENKRLGLMAEIRSFYLAQKAQQEKTIDVSISTAFSLTDEYKAALVKALTKKLEREVKISTDVDKSLLGGALIRAGDTVIDGSVKGRLTKLAESMNA